MCAMGHLLSGQERACTLLGCTRLKNALHCSTLSSDEIKSTGQRQQLEKRMKCAKQRGRGCKEIFRNSSEPSVWIADTENYNSILLEASVSQIDQCLLFWWFVLQGLFLFHCRTLNTFAQNVLKKCNLTKRGSRKVWFASSNASWYLTQSDIYFRTMWVESACHLRHGFKTVALTGVRFGGVSLIFAFCSAITPAPPFMTTPILAKAPIFGRDIF